MLEIQMSNQLLLRPTLNNGLDNLYLKVLKALKFEALSDLGDFYSSHY